MECDRIHSLCVDVGFTMLLGLIISDLDIRGAEGFLILTSQKFGLTFLRIANIILRVAVSKFYHILEAVIWNSEVRWVDWVFLLMQQMDTITHRILYTEKALSLPLNALGPRLLKCVMQILSRKMIAITLTYNRKYYLCLFRLFSSDPIQTAGHPKYDI